MRAASEEMAGYFAGTIVGDRLEVHAWRGGELVARDLPVLSWRVDWDADRQVQGMGTWVIADPSGDLAPWGMGDPLAPGGSRLRAAWVTGRDARISLGPWRIRDADPDTEWQLRVTSSGAIWTPAGGTVTLRADEETSTAVMERLDSEIPVGPTCIAEVRRLLAGICPVTVHPDVTDRALPSGLVYDRGRMDAVEDLLDMLDAVHRMGADGSLEVVPAAGVPTGWVIAGGRGGVLVKLRHSLSDAGVYNAARSTSTTAAGTPLVGRAYLEAGPLAWGGPFGRVPVEHQAIAQTQQGVVADARTLLTTRTAAGEIDLPVRCLLHPGVQMHDQVQIVAPTTAGALPLAGRVVGMSIWSETVDRAVVPAREMSLRVRVSAESLEALREQVVRRG